MPDYLDHGSRHRPGGSDPIPGLASGTGNDWIYTRKGLGTVLASASATAAWVAGDIIYQTDGGSTYGIQSGSVSAVSMLQVGTYLIRAIATFPGHAGTVLVDGVIAGDVNAYDYDVRDGVTSGTGGADATRAQAIWEQLCVVNSLTTPATAYVTFTNNTASSLLGVVAGMQIFRLT